MSPATALKLPFIDFSDEKLRLEWNTVRDKVRRAAEEFGCFEARFDNVSSEIRSAIFDAARELLDLPLDIKLQNVSDKPFHGYIGRSAYAPLYEGVGFDEANIYEKVETMARVFWPLGNPKFCKTIQTFTKELLELDQIVRKMILESLGVHEKQVEEHMASANYLFRVMKYEKPHTAGEAKLGLNSHTDLNLTTILYQRQVGGLEVRNQQGEWITVEPSPDSFIIFIGDSFRAYSNGRLHSPHHRVMMKGDKARFSTAVFCVPKQGCTIRVPEELVDEEHPLMFKPFDYFEFLDFYTTEAGRNAESVLDTFSAL